MIWSEFVQLFESILFTLTQSLGGQLGAGILCFSIVIRLAMLPLTLMAMESARRHRQALDELRPELMRLRKRWSKDPRRLAEESGRLFEKNGVSPMNAKALLAGVAQMPWILAAFSAVRSMVKEGGRFLWIGDLTRPDVLLTGLVALLTGASVAVQPQLPEQGRWLMLLLPTVCTLLVLSSMSAGVGLFWGGSNLVGLLQAGLLRRRDNRDETPA